MCLEAYYFKKSKKLLKRFFLNFIVKMNIGAKMDELMLFIAFMLFGWIFLFDE
jgi:hypothetical protein